MIIGGIIGGKKMGKLTVRQLQALKLPGMYADGDGLYVSVGAGGAKSWIFRSTVKGRKTQAGNPHRVEVGLGSLKTVSLAEARESAQRFLKAAREGDNPLDLKHRKSIPFELAARQVHAELLPTWRNRKHAETWLATVEKYACAAFGRTPIENVTTADIVRVLSPLWTEKHETAKRLSQRLSRIFDWAKGRGLYPHENPVNGVRKALPTVKTTNNHLPAIPWRELPAFMKQLRRREGISARTLEFIIFTAARSGEARGARWQEFDVEQKLWTVPAERMKRNLPHRVALSSQAIGVLEQVRGLDDGFVFPSIQRATSGGARPQSTMVFKSLLRRMGREDITPHGMRSAFRDWCSEFAHAERELAELALSHAVGDAVERAYARSDLLDRRHTLMERWGRFCAGEPAGF